MSSISQAVQLKFSIKYESLVIKTTDVASFLELWCMSALVLTLEMAVVVEVILSLIPNFPF